MVQSGWIDEDEARLVVKMQEDPIWFCREVLGVKHVWDKMAEMLTALKTKKKVVVKSGHGVGKSFTSACASLWFLYTHYPAKVITTAPSHNQVEDILWSEIRTLHENARIKLGGKVLRTEIQINPDWFAIGLSPRVDTSIMATRFQGYHSPNQLVIFDEAPGIQPELFTATKGLLTGKNPHWLCIGNPTSETDAFAKLFKEPGWYKMTISCLDSPNVIKGKDFIPGLVTKEWCDDRLAEWGEESSLYRTRVLGEFPHEGKDTLMPLEWILRAINKDLPNFKLEKNIISMGIDVARFGDNETVFVVLEGKKQIDKVSYKGKSITESTGQAVQLINKWNPNVIGIDDVGVGGGLYDNLAQKFPVVPYRGGMPAEESNKFFNLNAEAWWDIREDFRNNRMSIFDDAETIYQLNNRRYDYDDKQGRIKIETKRQMQKRGMESPDRAEAFVIAHWVQKQTYFRQYQNDEDDDIDRYKKINSNKIY